ncbi:MAG: cytochrome c biogenesis protein ResB [Dehalococcoidia bacterium]
MTARATAADGARPASPGSSPFKTLWDLLTNVKFALLLVGTALVASMLGVVIPQMPAPMRANPAARDAWLELQRSDFGALTTPMYRTGLFDVFHSPWFSGLWVVIIVAVTVCTVSRLRPTIRSVQRPPLRVPDRYFETAHYRASANVSLPPVAVANRLRAKHYRVLETHSEDGATYLFADRFPWTSYGTFLSHLALLMLLVGGLMTVFVGFDRTLALAETTSGAPVFDTPGPGQIFVKMIDAVRGVDDNGNVVDFRSHLEVTRGGKTITCTATVNDPCSAFGYRLHQAAFFDDVARLRIEGPGGQLLYDDILDFDGETAVVPSFRVTDSAGAVLFDEDLPQMGLDAGSSRVVTMTLPLPSLPLPAALEMALLPRSSSRGGRLLASTSSRSPDLASIPPASTRAARSNPPACASPWTTSPASLPARCRTSPAPPMVLPSSRCHPGLTASPTSMSLASIPWAPSSSPAKSSSIPGTSATSSAAALRQRASTSAATPATPSSGSPSGWPWWASVSPSTSLAGASGPRSPRIACCSQASQSAQPASTASSAR